MSPVVMPEAVQRVAPRKSIHVRETLLERGQYLGQVASVGSGAHDGVGPARFRYQALKYLRKL